MTARGGGGVDFRLNHKVKHQKNKSFIKRIGGKKSSKKLKVCVFFGH